MEQSYLSQLEKQYKRYLQNLVEGKNFETIILRGGKNKPNTTVELHDQIVLFQKNEKRDGRLGWTIQWEDWFSKRLGQQKWPSQINIGAEDDLLFLIGKKKHSDEFKVLLASLLQWQPNLQPLLLLRPELIHEHKNDWAQIIAVVDYLLINETTDLFIRSIPVPAHTKFIQQKKTLLLAILKTLKPERFSAEHTELETALGIKRKPHLFLMRLLDQALSNKHFSGIEYFAIPPDHLSRQNWGIQQVIFVENETNLYLLPAISGTLAIFSSGKALHLLKDISFFHTVTIYYWGDLDEEGFKMLHDIRGYYPDVRSLFMDKRTIDFHKEELHLQPYAYKKYSLGHLTHVEQEAYELLTGCNGRIEQERLRQDYVMEQLNAV